MKRNEIIELNGQEYILELNRESALKIEQRTNMQQAMEKIKSQPYEYIDEIDENEDPFADKIEIDKVIEEIEEKNETLEKLISVAFYIWLYPNHKLNIKQVRELLAPYFNDEEKMNFIGEKYGEYMKLSSEISSKYIEEQKNLKALANKK